MAVLQGHGGFEAVGYAVAAHHHAVGADGDDVLVVAFGLAQGVVGVEVLVVGQRVCGGRVAFGRIFRGARVAFGVVESLVSVEDRHFELVVVAAAIVVEVVAGRVVHYGAVGLVGQLAGGVHSVYYVEVWVVVFAVEVSFALRAHAVEAHVLRAHRGRVGVEGVGHAGGLRYVAPHGAVHHVGLVGCGQAVLEGAARVAQHVFRHASEVEVELAAEVGLRPVLVDEGVEHPEFDVFDVGRFEIGVVDLALYAGPIVGGVLEAAVGLKVGAEVVGAALVGVVGEVEHGDVGRFAVGRLAVGEELLFVDLAHVVVRLHVGVVADVPGRGADVAQEERVDGVPRQQCAAESGREVVDAVGFGEEVGLSLRDGGHLPCRPVGYVVGHRRAFEVVDIRRVDGAVVAGHQSGHFALEVYFGLLFGADQRQGVEQLGDDGQLAGVAHVQAQHGVRDGFVAIVDLAGECGLVHVDDGGAHVEVLVELVVEVRAEVGLRLCRHGALVLVGHVDGRARVEYALVQYVDLAEGVVHGVVHVFGQRHAAGRHHHRALRHVEGVERYFGAVGRLVAAAYLVLVLGALLLGVDVCAVVECREGVFGRQVGLAPELGGHVAAEGFALREDDASARGHYGVSFHKVVFAVGVAVEVAVHAVHVQYFEVGLAVEAAGCGARAFVEVVDVGRCGVVEVDHVEVKVVRLHVVGSQRVDVLHHQAPGLVAGCRCGAFEHLGVEALGRVHAVGREFAHLVGAAAVGVLVGHGQHLRGAQCRAERYVAQLFVERVFAAAQQARVLELLVVAARAEAVDAGQCGGHRAYVACRGVGGGHGLVERVGLAGRIVALGAAPCRPAQVGAGLAHVHECHYVARVGRAGAGVGYPHLDFGDVDGRVDYGQVAQGVVVHFLELVREEEVLVAVVVGYVNLEFGGLRAALGRHVRCLALFLREDGREGEASELHVGLDAEEALAALYQRAGQGPRYVAGLDVLQNVVFGAGVVEFHLVLEVEGGFGVVVDAQLHALAYLGVEVHLDGLVKVEAGGLAHPLLHGRVVDFGPLHSYLQRGFALQLHADGVAAKDAGKQVAVDLPLGVEQRVVVGLVVGAEACGGRCRALLSVPVVDHRLPDGVVLILFERHRVGHPDVHAAYASVEGHSVGQRVVFDAVFHVAGLLQVHGGRGLAFHNVGYLAGVAHRIACAGGVGLGGRLYHNGRFERGAHKGCRHCHHQCRCGQCRDGYVFLAESQFEFLCLFRLRSAGLKHFQRQLYHLLHLQPGVVGGYPVDHLLRCGLGESQHYQCR